ncbi:MAG: glycosyltransferase [Planctomycetota bacterium]
MKPVNLILVSGRHFDAERRSQALARDHRLAAELAGRGCAVRWMFPVDRGHEEGHEDAARAGGVSPLPVHTKVPGFRSVQARLYDPPLEQTLTRAVRADLPDVVHALAFGAGTSVNVAWLAERLGVPAVVTLNAREALCHRSTLLNERGESCSEWERAERCEQCCLTPVAGGLGPVAAACGRLLARLRWISPYPQDIDFQNRLEFVLGGLAAAQRLVVGDAVDVALLEKAGVQVAVQCLEDSHDAAALVAVYREMVVEWSPP